ncbi:uncharacterized protein LOC144072780 [Stigmatopora argus]
MNPLMVSTASQQTSPVCGLVVAFVNGNRCMDCMARQYVPKQQMDLMKLLPYNPSRAFGIIFCVDKIHLKPSCYSLSCTKLQGYCLRNILREIIGGKLVERKQEFLPPKTFACSGQCSAFGTLPFGDFVAPVLISRVLFDGNVLHWRDVAPTWMQTQMFASKLATLHHLLLLMFKKKPFHCVFQSLNEDRLLGNIKNVAITAKKEQFVGKRFKAMEMVEAVQIYKTKEVVYDVTKPMLKKGDFGAWHSL